MPSHLDFSFLGHPVILGSVAAAAAVRAAAHDELGDLVEVRLDHGVQAQLGAANDRTEPLLLDLILQFFVNPACVVIRNKHARIVLVPKGETLVDVGPNGA